MPLRRVTRYAPNPAIKEDTDEDSDTAPPTPDPITVTVYVGGNLSVGSAVAFYDGDGALLGDTITSAKGQVTFMPSDSAPVDIAAAVGDDVVFWAWVPGGAELVPGADETPLNNGELSRSSTNETDARR